MCWYKYGVFFTEGFAYFNETMLHHVLSTCPPISWLSRKRVWVLNWPAWRSDLSPTEDICCIMKWKRRFSWNPVGEEWETFGKLQGRFPQFPISVVKRSEKRCPWTSFFLSLPGINKKGNLLFYTFHSHKNTLPDEPNQLSWKFLVLYTIQYS